jgi:AraC-like DNA-binding protein
MSSRAHLALHNWPWVPFEVASRNRNSGWSRAIYGTQSVDLTWTYSNRQDLADLLQRTRRWVEENRQGPAIDLQASVRAKPNSAMPRRVVDRLGEDMVREIAEARKVGMKLKDVAKKYGISESSVKRIMRPLEGRSPTSNQQRTTVAVHQGLFG